MNTHHEELISAYLDGELTAAEAAEVDQLLADNADARALVAELRGLRDGLRGLPQFKPRAGFAADVLQRAQQAKTTQVRSAAQSNGNAPAQTAAQVARPSDTADYAGTGRRRGLFWAGLAVAAAVLIMLFSNPDRESDLAVNETAQSPTAETPGTPAASDSSSDDTVEMHASREESGVPQESVDPLSNGDVTEGFARGRRVDGLSNGNVSELQQADSNRARVNQPMRAGRRDALDPDPAGAKSPDAGQFDLASEDDGAVADPASDEGPGPFAEPEEEAADLAGSGFDIEKSTDALGDEVEALARVRQTVGSASAASDIVVFDYLAKNSADNVEDLRSELRRQLQVAERQAGTRASIEAAAAKAFQQVPAGKSGFKSATTSPAGVEFVYAIEGTDQQIAAVLERMHDQPDAFQLVAVDPRLRAMWGDKRSPKSEADKSITRRENKSPAEAPADAVHGPKPATEDAFGGLFEDLVAKKARPGPKKTDRSHQRKNKNGAIPRGAPGQSDAADPAADALADAEVAGQRFRKDAKSEKHRDAQLAQQDEGQGQRQGQGQGQRQGQGQGQGKGKGQGQSKGQGLAEGAAAAANEGSGAIAAAADQPKAPARILQPDDSDGDSATATGDRKRLAERRKPAAGDDSRPAPQSAATRLGVAEEHLEEAKAKELKQAESPRRILLVIRVPVGSDPAAAASSKDAADASVKDASQ